MNKYDGPAELVSRSGDVVATVEAHLVSQPPEGARLGSWHGHIEGRMTSSPNRGIVLGDVTLRLPGGRSAKAILTEESPEQDESAVLVGSGPPPF